MQTLKPPLILSQEKLYAGLLEDKLGQISGVHTVQSKSYVGAEEIVGAN